METQNDEISLKELIQKVKEWFAYFLFQWKKIVLAGVVGATLGLTYSFIKKPVYTASLSFALESNTPGGGLGGALGLASSLGFDLGGSGGGIFEGSNLTELFKSRKMVEKTLLMPIRFNDKTESFIKFAQEFCERAGVLSCSKKGDIYKSDDLQFRIDYFDVIRDEKGRPLPTPARISKYNGLIEVSKFHFKDMSIPMRMAILCHEFSHFYVNKNPESEIQADINGLRIYLALGYPRIDAYNVFLNVFQSASTNPETLNRFKTLDKFIKNYDYGKR